MALKLKYKDEHGVVHINMSPSTSPKEPDKDIADPKFDTINNRFAQYDLFGGKYDVESGGETPRSLFRSRYNSIEEELANTPYAFTTERSLRLNSANKLDITIQSRLDDISPSKDIEDDRFFKRKLSLEYDETLFGPQIDFKVTDKDTPAFTVTQLIHAQDRYFDLSGRQSESPCGAKVCSDVLVSTPRGGDEAFRVLGDVKAKEVAAKPLVPTPKRKNESSFAILAEPPVSRPTSPRSLPVDIRARRVSPFRGSGFRAETSRHNTPKTSTTNSRANSPPRRRTNSLSRIDNMAQTATLPLPLQPLHIPRLHSPRNFVKENIEGVRELSELNREKNEAEAEKRRLEEEEAILKEMGLLEKSKSGSKSTLGSKANSRSNSPSKVHIRSRSNSPSAILHYENIPAGIREIINGDDDLKKPVAHRSRVRTVSKSQPQSQDGSPKNTKIPQRQSSESPTRPSSKRDIYISRRPSETSLNKNQRFISSSASSIHETIRIGSQVHDKRASKSTQNLNISPAHIKSKPPISPGRGGPPPVNKALSNKRLSPIVGTPNKSPIDDLKPNSAKTSVKPTPMPRKNAKTAGNTPATSRINSRQPSRAASREPSPEKPTQRKPKPITKPVTSTTKPVTSTTKPVNRVRSVKSTQKPPVAKPEPKKPISRTNSVKSIVRTPSTRSLNEKPPLKKVNSIKNLSEKSQSITKVNEVSRRDSVKSVKKSATETRRSKMENKNTQSIESMTDHLEVPKQDNETQYDKITNDKNELVILTKKSVMSMTTAAITSQPLEVVTKVTNQLPAAFEKAREKGIFERLSSKDSLVGKEETPDVEKTDKEKSKEKEHKKLDQKKTNEDDKHEEKKPPKHLKTTHDKNNAHEKDTTDKNIAHDKNITHDKNIAHDKNMANDKNTVPDKNTIHDKTRHEPKYRPIFDGDIKLRPLLPHMLDDPQVERAKQKIEAILKEPEVSPENILTASAKSRELKNAAKEVADKTKSEVADKTKSLKEVADNTKSDVKEAKDEAATKLTDIKDQLVKQNEKMTEEIRSEATKIVDSIITPVEEPKDIPESVKKVPEKATPAKKDIIEPIIKVVNERKKDDSSTSAEKVNETLVKGDGEVEVQSSNVSTPAVEKMTMEKKMADGNGSNLSAQSNGGLPQSTSTTPKPPVRTKKEFKDPEKTPTPEPVAKPRPTPQPVETVEPQETQKDPNFCQRLIKKCKSKCCTCCPKSDDERELNEEELKEKKRGTSNLNCCKTTAEGEMSEQEVKEMERAAGKASIQYETETQTKRTRKLRDVLCGCCGGRRRVADTGEIPRNVAESMSPAPEETGCCGRKKRVQRRDSILSDRPPTSCCNNRLCTWFRGMCRRSSARASSRRTSLFSKNKSMSPTLPPEDNRKKLDTSLVEHTSMMRGAIPVLPIVLAFFCLFCNIIVPGLGTIFSGMFCLCFGIPRFGVHDGAKYRIGSFVINLLVGCGQLFTVLFCLVGWGWSIWWGVIMVKTSRKYRKLKREAEAAEAEAAPPVTANNHTRA